MMLRYNAEKVQRQDGLLTVRRFLDGARGGVYMEPNVADTSFVSYTDLKFVFR